MGVYINMEMPTEGYIDVRIKCNGTASFAIAYNPYIKAVEAVPVPPHGDLIDRDQFIEFIKTHWDSYDQWFIEHLEARHTIIPAEEGE